MGQRRQARHKFFLRNFYRKAVLSLPASERRRDSRRVAERLAGLEDFRQAKVVALYVALPHEVDMRPVLDLCRRLKKTVALPVADPATAALRFYSPNRGGSWRKNVYGIPEPTPETSVPVPARSVGLFLVPGRAYTPEGVRLGAGGGFYDRLFTRYPRAKRLGVAYDVQLVWRLPVAEGDQKVDAVLTPRRLYRRT